MGKLSPGDMLYASMDKESIIFWKDNLDLLNRDERRVLLETVVSQALAREGLK